MALAATLHHADGSEALTVVDYPDLELLEVEVCAPAPPPLVEAVRREVEKLGTRL